LPHLQKIHAKLKAQGFEIISINSGDPANVISKYHKEQKFGFPMVMDTKAGLVAGKYKVEAYPTNYLVGKDGKIKATFVGFDEQGLISALKAAGFKM
jgi:peroxiredoxin